MTRGAPSWCDCHHRASSFSTAKEFSDFPDEVQEVILQSLKDLEEGRGVVRERPIRRITEEIVQHQGELLHRLGEGP